MDLFTLRHIRALASKRGFSVTVDETIWMIVHKRFEQIQASFDLADPFSIDPASAQQFTLTRAYYWLRGYDLSYADNAKVLIRQGRSHPDFGRCALPEHLFDYKTLLLLKHEIAVWYYYAEVYIPSCNGLLAASQ